MYNVFLVEDEVGIRESIRDTLDWEAAGFRYLGDAPDGEIALKAIRKLKPDIVITDIKMPFMDGLELTAHLREEMPGTKVVILSGYDDFAYAQKAIRLGVVEFLLKPVSPSELMKAINKVAVGLRNEMAGEYAAGGDTGIWRQRRNAFLNDLLAGAIPSAETFSGMSELGIQFSDNYYIVALIKISAEKPDFSRDLKITRMAAQMATDVRAVMLERGQADLAVVFQGESEQAVESAAIAALKSMAAKCLKDFGAKLLMGVGKASAHLHELSRSLREAEIAINYAFFTGSEEPCLMRNVIEEKHTLGLELAQKLDQTAEFLQTGGLDETKATAGEISKLVFDAGGKGVALHYAYIDILMTAAKVVQNMSGNPEEVLPEFSKLGTDVFAIGTPGQFAAAITAVFDKIITYRQSRLASRYGIMMGRVKKFIDDNYSDPYLSLQKTAMHVHVSPTYFSAVFSKEAGETFSEYLSKVRMTNAMRLLKTTARPASEISEMVGYKDPQYFSRAFKRATGVSIRIYRSKN